MPLLLAFLVGTDLLVLGTATSTFAGNVQIANGYDLPVSNYLWPTVRLIF
jgi:hypothetical protein